MQKLGLPSFKSLEQFKSLSGSGKTFSFSSRHSSDSTSSGSFANLKLTAEKLVKEQASAKTDLDMANTKLKRSMEHVRVLEEKLQNAFNENAKLKVKQKEDEKLWKGLESKFSSTKTLCDQLTETLQHLACQVDDAEKDKEIFEGKLSASMNIIDCLKQQMDGLSLKLGSAEEIITNREKELEELKIQKEEQEIFYRDEQRRAANLVEDKDVMIKKFEATVAENKFEIENLDSRLGEVQHDLTSKENELAVLEVSKENLEKERSDLQESNDDFRKKLVISHKETTNLKSFVNMLAAQMVELDKQSLNLEEKLCHLNSVYHSCFKLVQQEKDLASKQAENKYNQVHDKMLCITAEKNSLQSVNQDLNNKITELQKTHESVTAQLSEDRRLAGDRIHRLESEAEALVSKKTETELLISKLEEKNHALLESLKSSEDKMEELMQKYSDLEVENKDSTEKLQREMHKREEEMDILRQDYEKHELHVNSLEKQVVHFENILEEKELLLLQQKDSKKRLEDQIRENQASLAAAESKLAEEKKQYDLMLEGKQLELSRHLKEISQRNDQAINDIRRKFEVEKLEITNMEKEKAEKTVEEMERKYDQKFADYKEESKKCLMQMEQEHAALVTSIKQEHERNEMALKTQHTEELRRTQLRAENELREKTMSIRKEHEVQMKALRCQYEDESWKLQEELDLQKTKEDRQRALLQLQWKVMSDKPQEDQEGNSKKEYSVSSIKMGDPGVGKRRIQHADDPPQTPMTKLLKKVENVNQGSVISIPKHHKKVTRHEYEVETANGRTIKKRRKTRSTFMFEGPRKQKKMNTPKSCTPRNVVKGGGNLHPSNIGDLFSEGSLNPYADDPYAFD